MMDMDDALGQEKLKTTLIGDPGSGHNPPDRKTRWRTRWQPPRRLQSISDGTGKVINLRLPAYLQKMLAAQLRLKPAACRAYNRY